MATMSDRRTSASRHLRTVFGAGAIGMLTDAQLLERFLDGRGDDDSAGAFAMLVERHAPMVLSVCRGRLGDLHDAEDAAQATFLVLARRAGSIRRADSLSSWLFGVALRVSAKARARKTRRLAVERAGAERRASGLGLPPEAIAELHEAIGRLPERLRSSVVLCHLEGLTNEQASARLGVPLRTIQRRLAEARERLRDRLDAPLMLAAVPEVWIEATAQAAARLIAGRSIASVTLTALASVARGKVIAALALMAALVGLAGWGGGLVPQPDDPPASPKSAPPTPLPAPPRSWIKGIVEDEKGRPVAGALVSGLWYRAPAAVMTDGDGAFVLPGVDPRSANQSLLATADGGARQGLLRLDDPTAERGPRRLVRIVVRPARELVVSVVTAGNTRVRGASVVALDRYFPVASGQTNDDGIAVFRVPADANMQWIAAWKSGVGFDYFERDPGGNLNPWSRPARIARLVLDGARTVRLRLEDDEGRPVPGVELSTSSIRKKGKLGTLYISGHALKARTGADGVAEIDWLPAELQGSTLFFLASEAYFLHTPLRLDPEYPEVERLTARVVRPTRISGKVTTPDGAPAAGVVVAAESAYGLWFDLPASGRIGTDADGSYAMDLPPEQAYLLTVDDDEWTAPTRQIVLKEGSPRAGLDLTLVRGCRIHGRLAFEDNAKPAPGVTLSLLEEGQQIPPGTFPGQPRGLITQFRRTAVTDEDGRYAFRVPAGTYTLHEPPVPDKVQGMQQLDIAADTRDLERDFTIPHPNPPARIAGTVHLNTPEGPTVGAARLIVASARDRWQSVYAEADTGGHFDLTCPSGTIVIYARDQEGRHAAHAVLDTKDARDINLVLKPAATVRGRVVDEKGKPWASVNVSYCPTIFFEKNVDPACPGQVILTDDDGRFTAVGVPTGETCYFYAYGPEPTNRPSRKLDVEGARTYELPPLEMDRPRPLIPPPH